MIRHVAKAALTVGALLLASSVLAQSHGTAGREVEAKAPVTPTDDRPFTEKWAPSKWGSGDAAGSANHTKNPKNVQRALGVVKQFKTVTLGKYYHREIPHLVSRRWDMHLPGTPAGGPFGRNAFVFHDELLVADVGQIGTQFDGPGHAGVNTSRGMFLYNGRMYPQSYEFLGPRPVGMGVNGVENVGEVGFVCRAVLLDAAAYKKMARLPIPRKAGDIGIITAADVKGMLAQQRIAEPGPGDCVFLHTGWGELWGNDVYKSMTSEQRLKAAGEFQSGEPGFGISACEYLASRDLALTGCDTNSCDAQPSGELGPDYVVPCHTENQTRRGMWNIENLDFKPLIDAKVYEFAFIFAPLKMIGATGSPANPIAIY